MADFPTQSANTVTQPAGNITGHAPPTPPETLELKSAEQVPNLPAKGDGPANAFGAASTSVPESAKESGQTGTPAAADAGKKLNAPEADIGIPKEPLQPIGSSLLATGGKPDQLTTPSTNKDIIAPADQGVPKRPLQSTVAKDDDLANSSTDKKADQFATQTDTPHESLIGTAPITTEHNATTAAARTEEAKHLAKPVSIEEVQDPEGPTTETSAVNNASKPEITNAAGDPPTPKGSKDLEMEDAKPSATKEPSQPGTTAAISELVDGEPKTGVKRKATESPITNRDANPEVKEAEVSAKKQKGSPIKNVINKVGAAVKKVGRPKKDQTQKKNPAPIGQTARRTRSQAKADAV